MASFSRKGPTATLILVASLAQAQSTPANIAAAKSAMAEGLNAMQRGNPAKARQDFARVVKLAPQVEPGHAALGSALLALGENEAAVQELDIARRLAPVDLAVDLNLGRALVPLGRFDAAVAAFRAALAGPEPLAFSPDESVAYATALSGSNQLGAAIDTLRKAVSQTPDSAVLNDALGAVLAQSGNFDQALPFFQRAVASDASVAKAQVHLAATLLSLNRADESIAPAKAAALAEPNSFDTQLQLGRALSAIHRDADALPHLHRAAELSVSIQSNEALYALALALQASGDAKAALPVFARVTASPTSGGSGALTNYALALVQTGDASAALPLYAKALAAGPDSPTLREDFGAAYLQRADIDDAVVQFKAGLALDSNSAHLHYDLGLAYKLKDDLASAVTEFEQAATLDPELPDPAYTLGVIYMQQGRFSEAITNLRHATTLQPANGDAWALLGSVLKDSGDPNAAADALSRAIGLQPDQPSLHIQLAKLHSQAGRTADAAAERKIAADLSRAALSHQRADFALKSGRTLLEQNKLPEAVLQLTTAIAADPTRAESHHLLAEAYTRQGKQVEAALEEKQAQSLAVPPQRQ